MATDTRNYILNQGLPYWEENPGLIANLPLPLQNTPHYTFIKVALPDWAKDLGHPKNSSILVDQGYLAHDSQKQPWECVDWLSYAFSLLNGFYEQQIEAQKGPIHSYAFKVKNYPEELWEYAWVNRIFLFLRRWAARITQQNEETLFGPLPKGEIILTHDVDALEKTFAIRLKQTAFHGFNSLKFLTHGKVKKSLDKLGDAIRFFIRTPSYIEAFHKMLDLEEQYNVRSLFTFYGGQNNNLKSWLFDPNYDIQSTLYAPLSKRLKEGKWNIGLHQSFDAWNSSEIMASQKHHVQNAFSDSIIHCRQHWLRFSWKETWKAQEQAGFSFDYTLGFNDRLGFRNGSALAFHPWDFDQHKPLNLTAIPMILMDSHLFDYQDFSGISRIKTLQKLIKEVMFVGGKASIIWHPHTLSADYSWLSGYTQLLDCLRDESVPR